VSHQVDAAAAWIYRGVWAGIVTLFKVPDDPPTLPATGEPVRTLRPSAGYLAYLKFLFWLAFIPGDILPVLLWITVALAVPILGVVLAVPALILMVGPDIVAYVGIHLRYDTTWYVLTDRSLRIRRGVVSIHETTISFENVQNVEVRQGPLQRYFGIADVVVQTAGGGGATHHGKGASPSLGAHIGILEGIEDAETVRDQILLRVERSRGAGLGDERQHRLPLGTTAAGTTGTGLSAAHLAMLREVRDAARRLAVNAAP
jgi:membrane protein YdbS with pleckstrin-like domain